MICLSGALTAVALALSPAPVHAEETLRLTSDEVANRAEHTSFELQARREELAAAEASIDQAEAGYVPTVRAGARYTRLSSINNPALGTLITVPGADPGPVAPGAQLVAVPLRFPVLLNQYAFTASLAVPLSDYLLRVPHGVASAEASERAKRLEMRAAGLEVAAHARVMYYEWVRSYLQLGVAEQTLEQTRAHLVDARHLFDLGLVPEADVLRAESQVAESELLLERTRNAAALREQQLRTSMHDTSGARYEIGESVDGEPVARAPQDLAVLRATAARRRLELKVFDENRHSLEEQGEVARAAELPRLDGTADVAYADPNPRVFLQSNKFVPTWSAGVMLSWTPTDSVGASAQTRAARARARALSAQRRVFQDAIAVELTRAYQAEQEAYKAGETSERRLRSAEEAFRVRSVLFRNGRGTNLELTDAQTELVRARFDTIGARVDQRIAHAQLLHAAGLDTPE
jgi:outer membrane protein TolC